MPIEDNPDHLSKTQILMRGLRGYCPCCGERKLFKRYIQQIDQCGHCGENFTSIRADDGPAWLTVLFTAHISVPLVGYFAFHDFLPQWQEIFLLLIITFTAMFLILPRAKGLFIAVLWMTTQKDNESNTD